MKSLIIKLSGKALAECFEGAKFGSTIAAFQKIYDGVAIVHGAGSMISDWSRKLGCEVVFHQGQRVTTPDTMQVVAAVQAGVLNHQILAYLHANGCEAIGLSGIDRNLFVADYINPKLGAVGYPKLASPASWIDDLFAQKIVPVFSSICRDSSGSLMNVNADIFTEALAESITADTVIFISDVDGVRLNGQFQSTLNIEQIKTGILSGEIKDGMIPKMESCMKLLEKGIRKIWIGSGLEVIEQARANETKQKGTWIVNSAA